MHQSTPLVVSPRGLRVLALALSGAIGYAGAWAQSPAPASTPTPAATVQADTDPGRGPSPDVIVITGSTTQRRLADAPYAISVVDGEQIRQAGPMINLSESMSRVPGMVVANRNNYAQDLQISSRGFGARAGFGVRGVRLYTDGIPASMPDGQGQVSHFDLAGAQRIEVLRGPFSVLYGNSSGGVIASVSSPITRREASFTADVGSFGLRQGRVDVAAPLGSGFDLRAQVSAMQSQGFRPQSEAEKKSGHLRLGWQGARDRVLLLVNALDQPADDPLGLTRAQYDADARQTTPQATQFDTRKTLRQQQVGAQWRHRFDAGPLAESAVTIYQGDRSVAQFLAIAAGTQAAARHGGGLIDFDRSYGGVDARATWRLGDMDVVTGIASDRQADDRRGYLNYTGTQASPTYGVQGALRREERNRARSNDAYAQADWRATPTVLVGAGVRSGKVKLAAQDFYLSNGDDSGERQFSYTNPVLGLRWQAAPGLNLHASVARGFESPTLGELAYRPDGTGGFNASLQPQRSKQSEVGAKWRSPDRSVQVDAAFFHIDVTDEIGVATNASGRQSFRNVGRTQRQGLEVGAGWQLATSWRAQTALTLLDATYRDGFLACAGIPCTAPSVPVAAGNRIAGTQRGLAYAELAWLPIASKQVALELRAGSGVSVNDTNSEATPRHVLVAVRASHRMPLGDGLSLDLLARVDNLANRKWVGSTIVNDANGRFFEPGAPRSLLLSARLAKTF